MAASLREKQDEERDLDLLIVGAGLYGICAANTYLAIHPEARVRVLDAGDDAGGVWSTARLYPQFWSQTGARLGGYPDVPFHVPDGEETYHDLFEAKHLAHYLENYLDSQIYDGHALRDRCVFRCHVIKISKQRDGDGGAVWEIHAERINGEGTEIGAKQRVIYYSARVIIATGLNSEPYIPNFVGGDIFQGLVLHQKDFGSSRILTPEERNKDKHVHITVLGGSKSAADIAYAAASSPSARRVSWIIRKSGRGPLIMTKAQGFGKYRCLPELGSTRAIASLSSADPYVPESWWSWFLHKTSLGERLLNNIWSSTEVESKKTADFQGRPGRLPGFEGLESSTSVRWRSGSIGLNQRDDFWDVIARKVQVYRADVTKLTEDAVVLDDGTQVPTDVLLCGTGWRQEHRYFEPSDASRLGLPISLKETPIVDGERAHWAPLDVEADREVLQRWPNLEHVPAFRKKSINSTPYRLYHLAIPVSDHSIAFLGLPTVPNSYHTALAQCLYAIAVLDSTLQLPPKEELEKRIAFINKWCERRYPVGGSLGNVLDFEMVSYTDMLLSELGLSSHRSSKGWWQDMTDPCLASDYAGLVDEYRRKYLST